MPPSTDDDAAPQRDSWMLAPPTASGYAERDPTRMRNRKFASKAAPQAAPGSSAASIWTETPEEKLQRLQDAVLGRGSGPAADGGSQNPSKTRGQEEREQRDRRIAASIEATRGQSLYEEHSQRRRDGEGGPRKPEDEEDDPSKRGFDREKDMAIGGKIGTAQRRELITKAANFGGRFQKGSFL
jgi:hypothetical protein